MAYKYDPVLGMKSWQIAESPFVQELNNRGIMTDFFNGNTVKSFNSDEENPYKFRPDIQTLHPYRVLLDAKFAEKLHINSDIHAGIKDSADCLRLGYKNVRDYRIASAQYSAEVWVGIKTLDPFPSGDYFIPISIFRFADYVSLPGRIVRYQKDKDFYLFDKNRCLDFDEFECYLKSSRYQQQQIMEDLQERFLKFDWFK